MNPQEQETNSNTPKDLANFKGQFVIFFSEEVDPKVLFSTFVADEAYKKAEEMKKESGKTPVVIRVQENIVHNIAQVLTLRV